MASNYDYNIGILGIKKPLECSCQELLSTPNIKLNGWLRKRSLRNKVVTMNWPQFYIVAGNQCLYYYSSEMSKKAAGSVSLYGYNRICRTSKYKIRDVVWAFKLEHIQPSIKSLYFSAPSEKEMIKWMSVIKQEMLAANGRESQSAGDSQYGESIASNSSWGSYDYKVLEGSIYEEPVNIRPISTVSDYSEAKDSDFEDDEQPVDQNSHFVPSLPHPITPNAPPMDDLGYSFQQCSVKADMNGKDYWDAVRFDGSKAEASMIINRIAENGVYLVRKSDDNLNVLVVYVDIVRKFKINKLANGNVTLSSTEPNFKKMEDLLYHYYSKDLPNSNQKLTYPFKLHDGFHEYDGV